MKRLIYIALLVLPLLASGQGLIPVQSNEIGIITASTSENDNLIVAHYDNKGVYSISIFDGISWTSLGEVASLPTHGTHVDGTFEIIDVVELNKEVFILGEYKLDSPGSAKNLVWKWDGTEWTDLTNSSIQHSADLCKFLVYKNDLTVVGVFEDLKSNLLILDDTSWNAASGWLTYNTSLDYFVDAYVHNDQIYASGRFTRRVGPDPYFTAIYNGSQWNSVKHPPFLRGSYHFTALNGELVLTGDPNGSTDYVKKFNGAGWDDISSGMEQYTIDEFWDIQEHDGVLYLSGNIWSSEDGRAVNLIKLENSKWSVVDWTEADSRINLVTNNKDLFITGGFDLFGIKNIGKLGTADASINGVVYLDKNQNCVQDSSEPGIAGVMLRLDDDDHFFWTDQNGKYRIPVTKGKHTIFPTRLVRYISNCPMEEQEINVTSGGNFSAPAIGLKEKPFTVDLNVASGFDHGYQLLLNESNLGRYLLTNNGTVEIEVAQFTLSVQDEDWSNLSFTPMYDHAEDGKYIWLIEDLQVGESVEIKIEGRLQSGADLNNVQLDYTATVKEPSGDVNLIDNSGSRSFKAVEYIEPIYKQSGNGSFFYETDPLNYYIRFANVGNGTVKRVIVRDTLDEDIVVSRYGAKFLSSHKADFNSEFIVDNGKYRYIFTWVFDGINLEDSSSNPNGYVGYVDLTIHLAEGYHATGTVVCNQADVFFDKQEPYRTNEVCIDAWSLGVPPTAFPEGILVYPNPVNDILTIVNQTTESQNIRVINSLGVAVYDSKILGSSEQMIDVRNWTPGAYFAVIEGGGAKLIIVQ